MSIFNYESPRQFLLDFLADKQHKDSKYSIRSFARDMGLPSHTLLVMILQGKRPLRVRHAMFLAKGMALSSQERLFLQALIQFDSAEDPEEKKLCGLWLSDLHPTKEFKTRELSEFTVVSHWVHMAILAMTSVKDFDGTAEQAHLKLRDKVSIHEVRAALERLLGLGLLTRTATGKLKPTYERITSRNDVADLGAQKYHQGVMELAQKALEKVPVDRREFQAFSLAVPEEKIPLAKEMIRKFRSQFAKAIGSESGDHVYQMNIQLFPLTETPADPGDKNA